MNLNHLHLKVREVARAMAFYNHINLVITGRSAKRERRCPMNTGNVG